MLYVYIRGNESQVVQFHKSVLIEMIYMNSSKCVCVCLPFFFMLKQIFFTVIRSRFKLLVNILLLCDMRK